MEGIPSNQPNRKVEDMSEVSEHKVPATLSAADRLLEAQRRKREATATQHAKDKAKRAENGNLRYWEKEDF